MANSHTLGTYFSPVMHERHRKQTPPSISELLGGISLLSLRSTFYPLSDGLPFRTTGSLHDLLHRSRRHVAFAVKLAYAIALTS